MILLLGKQIVKKEQLSCLSSIIYTLIILRVDKSGKYVGGKAILEALPLLSA